MDSRGAKILLTRDGEYKPMSRRALGAAVIQDDVNTQVMKLNSSYKKYFFVRFPGIISPDFLLCIIIICLPNARRYYNYMSTILCTDRNHSMTPPVTIKISCQKIFCNGVRISLYFALR